MQKFSFFFLCVFLLACSARLVQGMSLQVRVDDMELQEPILQKEGIPGVCGACKWALKKLKQHLGQNATVEVIAANLRAACKGLVPFKSQCTKFVEKHFQALVKELMTTDDVKTICIKTGGCKPKDKLDLIVYPNKQPQHIKISELP